MVQFIVDFVSAIFFWGRLIEYVVRFMIRMFYLGWNNKHSSKGIK